MRTRMFCIITLLLCFCTVVLGSQENDQEAELSPFKGTFGEALWAVFLFIMLLIVLWKFAWKPMLAGLHAREDYIAKQVSDAENTRKDAQDVLHQYQEKLANADNEGQKIIESHIKKAEQQGKEIIAQAKEEIEAARLKLEVDIERARNEAQVGLLNEAGHIVLKLGEEILGRNITDQDNEKLIDEAIARMKQEDWNAGKMRRKKE